MSAPHRRAAARAARRLVRREGGQSLIEFAIVVPILLALLIAIFEFGRAWNIQQVITNTAREGARLGVLSSSSNSDVQQAIDDRLTAARLDPAEATVTLGNVAGAGGSQCTVEVEYPYNFMFMGPVVRLISGGAWPGSILLSSTSIMRNE